MMRNTLDTKQIHQKNYYNVRADVYDTYHKRENANHLYKIEEIAKCLFLNLRNSSGKWDFMELGGGTGIHAYHFLASHRDKIRKFVFTDLSERMIERAKTRLQKFSDIVEYIVMPGECFATDSMFDGIYISGAMHHFSDPCRALKEIRKHLKPGGSAVICEPVVWNPVNFVRALIKKEDWGQFYVTRRNIRRFLKEFGYNIVIDRVLHFKTDNPILSRLWHYKVFERIELMSPLAVMFLFCATRNT